MGSLQGFPQSCSINIHLHRRFNKGKSECCWDMKAETGDSLRWSTHQERNNSCFPYSKTAKCFSSTCYVIAILIWCHAAWNKIILTWRWCLGLICYLFYSFKESVYLRSCWKRSEEPGKNTGEKTEAEASEKHQKVIICTASAPLSILNGCPILSMLFGKGSL